MILDYVLSLFDWCKVKIFLTARPSMVLFKDGELWWCRVGMNIGVEIYGKGKQFIRPVLVFKKLNEESFIGIPLTSQHKEGSWFTPVHCGGIEAIVILAQVRTLDSHRLAHRIETLSDSEFLRIRQALLSFLAS